MSTATGEPGNSFVCGECGNHITTTDDPSVDHHSDCPLITNFWIIQYGGEHLCFLCDTWLIEGDTYRLLPMLPEELSDDLEGAIGVRTDQVKVVCLICCALHVIRGGRADTDTVTA